MMPVLISLGPIVIHSFGVMLVVSFVLGSFVIWRKAREENYDEEKVFDLILFGSFWGLIGSRVAYVVLNYGSFGFNLINWLSLWGKPGFHWIGFLIGVIVYLLRFCKMQKWDFFEIADLTVVGVSLVQSLMHLGLFLAGSGVGRVTSLPVGVTFPGVFEKRHPVGLYGFLIWFGVFWGLWWLEGHYRRFEWYQRFRGSAKTGFVAFSYFILLGFVGLVLALLSEPEYLYSGVDLELVLRVLILVLGAVGIYLRSGASVKGVGMKVGSGRKQEVKKDEASGWKRRRQVD